MHFKKPFLSAVALALLAAAPLAAAHTGAVTGGGLAAGLLHPLSGLDHLLAALAVGLWAGRSTGPRAWTLPVLFLAGMALALLLTGIGLRLPAFELGIAASLVLLGAALFLSLRPGRLLAVPAVTLFALMHGHAHAVEAPASAAPLSYLLGLLAATGLLHLAGLAGGRTLQGSLLRFSGLAIGAAGLYFAAAA